MLQFSGRQKRASNDTFKFIIWALDLDGMFIRQELMGFKLNLNVDSIAKFEGALLVLLKCYYTVNQHYSTDPIPMDVLALTADSGSKCGNLDANATRESTPWFNFSPSRS
jgi:hypothetical protein